MRADVGYRTRRAAARFLDAPVRVGREKQPILEERAARRVQRTEERDASSELDDQWMEPVVVGEDREASRLAREGYKLLGSAHVDRERLLADHVLPGTERAAGKPDVQVVRGADVHHAHGRI